MADGTTIQKANEVTLTSQEKVEFDEHSQVAIANGVVGTKGCIDMVKFEEEG